MNALPWAVVLAGGDGTRGSELTRAGDGQSTPKQYCRLGGHTPMVRWAIDRARRVVPSQRILVVVNEAHRRFWEAGLQDIPGPNLLVQPANRGTAAAVLLAVLAVESRTTANAPVLLLPSDHFIADECVMADAMSAALGAAQQGERDAVLLGMNPTGQDHDYGWILPSAQGSVAGVSQFVEKPAADAVPGLLNRGALINSFVIAGRVQALLGMFVRTLPEQTAKFRSHIRPSLGVSGLSLLYEAIPSTDLSRHVLQPLPDRLAVVRVPPCGWSDLGTPARLLSYLSQVAVAA